ncbi:hypothetical protein NTGM5_760024 [Candidatus Nitrotoga sp. M5]|nr:hypothetical protein NTGM5_760024 [Candidatus Nitrotoga sp. M5]
MRTPLQITIRNVEPSKALDARLRDKTAKIEQFINHTTPYYGWVATYTSSGQTVSSTSQHWCARQFFMN